MARDYFTRAEFRDFAEDPVTAPPGDEKYSDADIDRVQAEVIEHLEAWAFSSWANVTGVAGDGTAADYRLATELFDGGDARYLTHRIPIESIESLEIAGVAQVVDENYWLYKGHGEVRFASELNEGFNALEVEYRYGHGVTPQAIKRPAMSAAKALLDNEPEGGIPSNVTEYNVEGTTFLMREEPSKDDPWPWDLQASRDVHSYWDRKRPGMTGARV